MRKVYLPLTQDQKQRGVVFSIQLRPWTTIHEVKYNDRDRDATIDRLLDDKFLTMDHIPGTRSGGELLGRKMRDDGAKFSH